MKKEKIQEYTLKITQANRTQLVVILYEMILCYIEEAKNSLKSNSQGCKLESNKAQKCIWQLIEGLDFTYELSYRLLQLYMYANRELIRADIRKDPEALEHAENIVKSLCQAFEQLSIQDQSKPLMENTQAVYAGLTYGKKELTENLHDQGSSRGFCV